MVRPVIHDPVFLAQKSAPATEADLQTVIDLLDTLCAHRDECVGMAANMIGVKKNIIVFSAGPLQSAMLNAAITKKTRPYEAFEGCLSLAGGPRRTVRYEEIEVEYQDTQFRRRRGTFSGRTAQIIQHELDHVAGVLI